MEETRPAESTLVSEASTTPRADKDDSAAPNSAPPMSVGELIDGRYEVKSTLGEGAMGVVYLAEEGVLERDVAIKTISSEWAHDAAFAKRFRDEARALAKIRHPNVVQVFTFGMHSGAYYLAMELVRGASLSSVLQAHKKRGERLSVHNAVAILAELISGVVAIHDAGLIHCDLKPSNVVVENDTGRPVIIDFGVATKTFSTEDRELAGSPAYMAPELAEFGEMSEQSDIYAVGCTAFELLTSRLPYDARSFQLLLRLHASAPVPRMSSFRPELRPFDDVIARALGKRPQDRYASAAEMQVALDEAQARWTQRLAAPDDGPASTPGRNEVRILVVDDDPSFRRAATRAAKLAFNDKTIRALPASSGEEALAIAARRMPNLIMLDYMLPNLDGVATLSAIRSLPGGRETRVVVMSGSVEEVRFRFTALGVNDFFSKPVELDEMIESLQAIARRSKWFV